MLVSTKMDVYPCSGSPPLNLSLHYRHSRPHTSDPLQVHPPSRVLDHAPAIHDAMDNTATGFLSPPAVDSSGLGPRPAVVETPISSAPMTRSRKRKAESQENERLSKRLSLLNIGTASRSRRHVVMRWPLTSPSQTEKNGQKLYVPVESPYLAPTISEDDEHALPPIPQDDTMRLDDSAHKVYIYNLDDELSSSDTESTCSIEDNNHRLVFLADIDKHLRHNRIPASVFANQDGEIAGTNINDMQLVLYSDPSSLTVAGEQDNVRKAIIEARNRMRQKQKEERDSIAVIRAPEPGSSLTAPAPRKLGEPASTTPMVSYTSMNQHSATDEMELD